MYAHRVVRSLALAVFLVGCAARPSVECIYDMDCSTGSVCYAGACTARCDTDEQCIASVGAGATCSRYHVCRLADAGTAPADAPDIDAGPETDAPVPCSIDADGDGACDDVDCDDSDPTRGARTDEVCTAADAPFAERALDEDCDGAIDETCPGWWVGVPHPVEAVLVDAGPHTSPRLSRDGLRLYYVVAGALHVVERAAVFAPFGSPTRIEMSPPIPGIGPSFALTRDELTLYAEGYGGAPTFVASRGSRAVPFAFPDEPPELTDMGHLLLRADDGELLGSGGPLVPTRRFLRAADGTLSPPDSLSGPPFTRPVAGFGLADDGRTALVWHVVAPGAEVVVARRAELGATDFTDEGSVGDGARLASSLTFADAFISERTAEIFFTSNADWNPVGSEPGIWRARICRDGPCLAPDTSWCPDGADGTIQVSRDGLHCYRVADGPGNWEDGMTRCGAERSGELASVLSAAEQALVTTLRPTGVSIGAWVGLRLSAPDAPWSTGAPLTYAAWASGEPMTPPERCVYLDWSDGAWRTESCDPPPFNVPEGWVCEREVWPTW